MSKMERRLLIVAALLAVQTVCQARLPTRPCNGARPLKGANNSDLFCGRGPNRVACPPGSYCDIHPADRWAKCCPRRRVIAGTPRPCFGDRPLTNPSTGQPYNCRRSRCPRGSLCHAHPADAYAVCCKFLPCKGRDPLKDRRGRDLFCGLGGQRCSLNSYCDVHPLDRWAKCCRDPICANRRPGVPFVNARCTQRCTCNVRGRANCHPLCPQVLIRCQKFYVPKFFKVRIPGTRCNCSRPRCVPVIPRPCFGDKPLTDPRTGSPYNCFRKRCPSGAFCHAHPADAFSVCCRKHAKPGRCPKNNVTTPCGLVRPGCISDRQCTGNKKCCRFGCSSRCLTPIPCGPVCLIYCPYGNVYKDGCPTCKCRENPCNLVDCPPNRARCIVVNRQAKCVPVVAKPGRCPKFGAIIPCRSGRWGCRSDRHCPGNKKCCRVGCLSICLTPVPCGPVCEIFCRYGKVIKDGCPICKCKENPCNRVNCPPNRPRCIVVNRQARCVRVVVVKPGQCPRRRRILCKKIIHRCSTDTDCKGAHKCCFVGCGRLCGPPIPAPIKPGRCPRRRFIRCRLPRPVHRCRVDHDCRGRQKCCAVDRCGRRCVNPVPVVKPGKCPRRRFIGHCSLRLRRCRADSDCRGRQKCCTVDRCGRRCMNPVPVVKPGKCPRLSNSRCGLRVHRCRVDSDCLGRQKCCTVDRCGHRCVNPVQVIKPGKCPSPSRRFCFRRVNKCLADSDCRGRQKCCERGCGRMCVNPVRVVKPGRCPVPLRIACFRAVNLCFTDANCRGRQKCCFMGCGRRCVNPAPVIKPGKCPRISNARCRPRLHRCRGDFDCRGIQKCCTVDRCGRKCVNPVPVIKPGLCPNTSGIITPCVVSPLDCFSDAQCLGRKKCCSFGCSRRCLNPVPKCGPICKIYCKFGFVYQNGCPICRCRVPFRPVGVCPKPTGPGVCAELCGNKCSGGKICCFNGCGHQCMNPVPVIKPGICPNTSGIFTPCVVSSLDCSSDAQCPARKKCCRYGCGRRCLNPVPKCGPNCRMYCKYGFVRKNGCPICKCRVPVKRQLEPVGSCPKPTGPGVCAELCGNKCTGGKICCFNGCGHQCMHPGRD